MSDKHELQVIDICWYQIKNYLDTKKNNTQKVFVPICEPMFINLRLTSNTIMILLAYLSISWPIISCTSLNAIFSIATILCTHFIDCILIKELTISQKKIK